LAICSRSLGAFRIAFAQAGGSYGMDRVRRDMALAVKRFGTQQYIRLVRQRLTRIMVMRMRMKEVTVKDDDHKITVNKCPHAIEKIQRSLIIESLRHLEY
jgi:hypothetical protein